MIRLLARLFSALTLVALLVAAYLAVYRPIEPAPAPAIPLTQDVDHILIEKAARKMTVFADGVALKTYDIALGFSPVGDKVREGDGKTPEGTFKINRRNAKSSYHLSLGINYPQPDDITRARAAGVSPGGDIFIHGQPNAMFGKNAIKGDWTAGCVAVTDPEIRELFKHVAMGTTVDIKP